MASCRSSNRVLARGLFDPAEEGRIRARPNGRLYPEDQLYRLWTLLLTEIWAESYLDHRGERPGAAAPVLARAA